ncbi:hypothetical protein BT93_L3970 [Corymbia citriodora subsp. variegata]|uniref:TF-B3 domain-containing protein n=1 Tax=Corymbia citriodora subsp. variegata TaxID=360336 RepID=A0A8T0CGJ9_CORYI|nr:hypothetical protein BT93_L3970 [Corymbia citriodora subsp. variegata]
MERSQSQSGMPSGDPTVGEEAKEVLQASLCLSILTQKPPVVQRVNALIDCIGPCRGPFEKQVKASDLREQQNRLLLQKANVREFVLPLLREDDDPKQGMAVTAFDMEGEAFPVRFKLWCSKVYVLMSGWKEFVRKNRPKESDILQMWAFRDVRTEGLCFLIAVRRSKVAGQSADGSTSVEDPKGDRVSPAVSHSSSVASHSNSNV